MIFNEAKKACEKNIAKYAERGDEKAVAAAKKMLAEFEAAEKEFKARFVFVHVGG